MNTASLTRRQALQVSALAVAGLATPALAQTAASPRRKPIRIAALYFVHETVTFLSYDTTYDDFIYEGSPARGEALLKIDPKGYMGGFTKVAREYEGVEIVGIESPLFPKTGTASGWITEEAYSKFSAKMMEELRGLGPFDAVYMALHGAMGVRGVDEPEVDLARRVREIVGPNAFIAGTFDPHGNEDDRFLRYANFAFCTKYYPHYDTYLQGMQAARALVRAVRGDFKPVSATRKVPIVTPTVLQWTGKTPWMDLVQRCLVWEAREPDVYVNFFFGFPWSDVSDLGMCFQVITNGDPELANHIAADMAASAWRLREALVNSTTVHTIADGVGLAKEALATGKHPVVLADHSDRSGAATWLLGQVIEQDLSDTLIITVADRLLIEKLRKDGVKVGDAFDHLVGGRLDESAGDPVRVVGTVNTVTGGMHAQGSTSSARSGQLWVSVKFGKNNVLVISPYLVQVTEPEPITSLGINPDDFKVIAIKSRVHFRRGFDDNGYAQSIFIVEPPEAFLGTVKLEGLPYQNFDLSKVYPFAKDLQYTPEA